MKNIFEEEVIKKYLENYHPENYSDYEQRRVTFVKWVKACKNGTLKNTKEVSVQGPFLNDIFGVVLGYASIPNSKYNLLNEVTSELDSTEADGGLGFFDESSRDVRVVIELKDISTDLDKRQNRANHQSPVDQAFSYAHKNGPKCGWVIVSNFNEIRLYKSNSSLEYQRFILSDIESYEEFSKFLFFLEYNNLIKLNGNSLIDTLYLEKLEAGKKISDEFYEKYTEIRNGLWESMKSNNSSKDEVLLFTKAQKVMDRILFICFCEDTNLLPYKTIHNVIQSAKNIYSASTTKIWDQFKGLFNLIDIGNPEMNINHYNGGLFSSDPDLDNLIVSDEILLSFETLASYDFKSKLNVNILGHIFEQSITDIETIKSEILGIKIDRNKTKKKQDGVFYTKEYVTEYIVRNTIGRYLNEKKSSIISNMLKGGFTASVINPITNKKKNIVLKQWYSEIPNEFGLYDLKQNKDADMERQAIIQMHYEFWCRYERCLKEIKILDCSVGSGAFLTQAFDFLHREIELTLETKQSFDGQLSTDDINKQILQNNLYGVDINPESVEITKLSLWLKTAQNNQTLASLDNNIKCGNSIIADNNVDPLYAFDWEIEFKDIVSDGGWDIVIGNPPYGATLSEDAKKYLRDNYITTEYNYDTYKTFFELGGKLLKNGGYLGYITPNTYFNLILGANKLRKFLFDNFTLLNIVELFNVFEDAIVDTTISIYKNQKPNDEKFNVICVPRCIKPTSTFLNDGIITTFTQKDLKKNSNYVFNYRASNNDIENSIFDKINKNVPLTSNFDVTTGAKPYQTGKGTPPQTKEVVESKVFEGFEKVDENWKPYYRGESIGRFQKRWDGLYIKFGKWLAEPRYIPGEKLFVRQTADSFIAAFDVDNVCNNTIHMVTKRSTNESISLWYILSILNSELIYWYFKRKYPLEDGKTYCEVKGTYVKELPIAYCPELVEEIEDLAKLITNEYYIINNLQSEFVDQLQSLYKLKRRTNKLKKCLEFDASAFCDELSKCASKLKIKEKMELVEIFNEKQKEYNKGKYRNLFYIKSLDMLVYKLYGISEDEVQYINSSL